MAEDHEIQEVADRAAREAVDQFMQRMGIDTRDPQAMREDFVALREFRKVREKGKLAAIWALVTAMMGGIAAAVWDMITKGGVR